MPVKAHDPRRLAAAAQAHPSHPANAAAGIGKKKAVSDEEKGEEQVGIFHGLKTYQVLEIWCMIAAIATYGVGNGAFYAVDLALALDCLPDPDNSAADLGIWGVSAFLGLAIGPMLWGSALEVAGGTVITHNVKVYPYTGYVLMLVGGCFFCAMAGLFVKFIKKAK